MLRSFYVIILLLVCWSVSAQTLGGAATFNFLKLPATPLLSATGGANVSYQAHDAGLAAYNPALLEPALHGQIDLSFNSFYAGIKSYNLTGDWHLPKSNTTLGANVFFIDYGSIVQTDAAGNESGSFHPRDLVFQLSGARQYLERWHYGATVKYIASNYQVFSSSAIAVDIGILYEDTAHLFTASFLARNMGMQLKGYAGIKEDLPFDLQVGLTKRLAKAPLGFSLTLQQVHQFDLFYNDTTYNKANNLPANGSFFNKLFNHFVLATHIYLGANLEASIGYNQLRRSELNIGSNGNGLNGFSLGIRASFKKLKFQYARSYYQRSNAYNQFSIGINLKELTGLGSL